MKHDPRHIILIPLLAIIMAACSDTPLPAPAPAPGDIATVIFSLNLNSSSPTASRALSRAETTEIRTAWDPATDPAIIPGWWTAVAADRFADITAGTLTITYSTADNTPKRLAITTNGFNLYDANTPAGAGDLSIELTAEQAAAVAASGLSIGSYNVTVTKITYSVTTGSSDPDPQPTETKVRTAWDETNGTMTPQWNKLIPAANFTNITAGPMTITYSCIDDAAAYIELKIDDSNKIYTTNTPDAAGDMIITITDDQASKIATSGLYIGSEKVVITKITYTAKITGNEPPEDEIITIFEGERVFADDWNDMLHLSEQLFNHEGFKEGCKIAVYFTPSQNEQRICGIEGIVDVAYSSNYLSGYKYVESYTLTDTQVNTLKTSGTNIRAFNRTVTKVTISVKKTEPVGPDPIDPGLLWKDKYNPGDEDAADCVIDPAKLHLLIYDSDTEKLIAWVNGVRLTDQSGDDRHYGGELSISLEAFKDATGGTRTADGTTTSNAAGVTESVNEVTVIALANWSASVVTPLLSSESKIADLEAAAATFNWNAEKSAKENGYIPMWGQSRIHVDFSTDNLANLLDIKLLRSLAKVKIMLKNDADSPASTTAPYYDIASVRVNNYAPQGYYMPSGIRMDNAVEGAATPLKPATTELSVADCINAFTTAAPQSTPVMMLPSGVKSYILYLPEQLNDAESATRPSIDISIKSLHAGNDIPVGDTVSGTLHFTATGLADEAPKNIIRNHQYDFTVRIDGGLKFSVTVADMIDGGTYSYEYVIK